MFSNFQSGFLFATLQNSPGLAIQLAGQSALLTPGIGPHFNPLRLRSGLQHKVHL